MKKSFICLSFEKRKFYILHFSGYPTLTRLKTLISTVFRLMRICCHYCFCRDLHGLEHRTVLFMFCITGSHLHTLYILHSNSGYLSSIFFSFFHPFFVRQAEASPLLACRTGFDSRKKEGSKKQILHTTSMDGPFRPYKQILFFFSLHIYKSHFCQVPTSSQLLPCLQYSLSTNFFNFEK